LSRASDLCRNVKRWRDANTARRWAGTVLREAENRFNRIQGYREMPLLVAALGKAIDSQEAVARSRAAVTRPQIGFLRQPGQLLSDVWAMKIIDGEEKAMRLGRRVFRVPENVLVAATIVKMLLILLCYQHVVDRDDHPVTLCKGYGWDELVSNMGRRDYSMLVQTELSGLYDMRSESYRPPVYPFLLYSAARLSRYSAVALVLLHSIITSSVAYLGYLLVKASTGQRGRALLCLWGLFVFPMNFLKSGSIDEAPLMVALLLAALWWFIRYRRNRANVVPLVLSGLALGFSTMTRYTTLFVAVGLCAYVMIRPTSRRSFQHAVVFLVTYVLVLVPWICRNYSIYGVPVLSVGSARLLLATQSEDFIGSFPWEHMDTIERRFLRAFHESHGYLSELHGLALDREFKRHAASEMRLAPVKFLRALVTKARVFIPYRYYPLGNSIAKDLVFVVPYSLALLAFFWTLSRRRRFETEHITLLIAIAASIVPGLIYFMLSRHLYTVTVIIIVFVFAAWPAHRSVSLVEST
jgi:hypothetical protein